VLMVLIIATSGFIMYRCGVFTVEKSTVKNKSRRRILASTTAQRSIIHSRPLVLGGPCASDKDCSSEEACEVSRIYRMEEFDENDKSLVGKRLLPHAVDIITAQNWSVTDLIEIDEHIIISTNSNNVVVQSIDGDVRSINSNIKIDELAIYNETMFALQNNTIYEMDLENLNNPTWKFSPTDHYGDSGTILSIESSRDGRAMFVQDNETTRVFLDGELDDEISPHKRFFGATPDNHVMVSGSSTINTNTDQRFANTSNGVFDEIGNFIPINNKNKNIKKIRFVNGEPVFVTNRVCKNKKTMKRDIVLL
jgi:hypothetical protein